MTPEQKAKRLHYHMYETCEGIQGQSQRIVELEELCADLLKGFECGWPSDVCGDCERDGEGTPIGGCKLENRARELGVKVGLDGRNDV